MAFDPTLYFTPDELDDYQHLWELYDKDGSGGISHAELREGLHRSGLAHGPELEEIVSKLDKNQDGQISFEEFLHAQSVAKGMVLDEGDVEDARKTFRLFDADDSGTISVRELGDSMAKLGWVLDRSELEQLEASVDADKDGTVSFEEFYQLVHVVRAAAELRFEVATLAMQVADTAKEVAHEREHIRLSGERPPAAGELQCERKLEKLRAEIRTKQHTLATAWSGGGANDGKDFTTAVKTVMDQVRGAHSDPRTH
jgi:Ca2+-binding EF-hand superfamily protein